jgi:hypothetical protein
MPDRKWIPTEYQDEVIPPPRDTPDAWLRRATDGTWLLAPSEDLGFVRVLVDGDIVEFDWTVNLGSSEFVVRSDGPWHIDPPAPEPPDGCTLQLMEAGDPESMEFSVENFARNWLDRDRSPTSTTVVFYAWSNAPVAFVFNKGAFHPRDPAPGAGIQ